MKVTMRELEGAELEDSMMELRRTATGQDLPVFQYPEHFSHVYRWYRNHPLGDRMRRWTVYDGDQTVGHVAAMPQYYRIGGERVVAYSPANYMVLPQYGFQALSLMRTYFRNCQDLVTCDMISTVIQVERRMGAEEAGKLQYAAKLLNVSRLPVPPVPARLRKVLKLESWASPAYGQLDRQTEGEDIEGVAEPQAQQAPLIRPRLPLPAPIKKVMNQGLEVVDEVLGVVSGENLEVEPVEEFDESFDELFEAVAEVMPCVAEKDAAFLRWRYGPDSPQAPVTVLAAREEGKLLGYVVMVTNSTGEDGHILDLTTLPGRHDAARALLRGAVRSLRKEGVQIIRNRFLQSPTSPRPADLWRLGFFFRSGRSSTLLVKFTDQRLQEVAQNLDNWSYNFGDGELSFWLR